MKTIGQRLKELNELLNKAKKGTKYYKDISNKVDCVLKERNEVITHNLGMVHHIVRRMRLYNISEEDAIQYGTLSLIKLIDDFKPSMDVTIATRAYKVIYYDIRNEDMARGKVIRVPTYFGSSKKKRKYSSDRDRVVKSEILNFTEDDLPILESELEDEDEAQYIKKAISKLPEKFRTLIEMRFYNNMTLEQIGQKFGVTRQCVLQRQTKALQKLRMIIKGEYS
jgi:RNA polymerase sigma factor (sigma-70 family)